MIDTRRAYTYFFNRYAIKKSSNNWYMFDCVCCDRGRRKKKMAVHFGYEMVKCWECETRLRIIEFVQDMENLDYYNARQYILQFQPTSIKEDLLDSVVARSVGELEMPHGFVSLLDGRGKALGERALKYLTGRRFDVELLDSMGFGYCNKHYVTKGADGTDQRNEDYFGRIIIPFKRGGKLYYFIGRTFVDDTLRYKNPSTADLGIGSGELLFNEDALQFTDTVFVLEGAFDAMTLGEEAVATLKWKISLKQRSKLLRCRAKRLVIVPDIGYYTQAVTTALDFLEHKEVYVLPMDKLKKFGKDVNDMGREKVLKLYEQTPPLTYESAMEIIM